MRYQDWDILVFPDKCKIPLQEFKTSCQVVQDAECHSLQTNAHLLPTVTCFIPGLAADTPFRISLHCWQNPETSRYLKSFGNRGDNVMFEARLFIDGKIVSSKWFYKTGPWPTILDLSVDLDKHGDFEKLKFPTFHNELLSQSYWSAGDDLGRIKLIISEGFARDNLTYPYERIKNIVSFSFQHAPLDILEASSIAWPNASMWRQVALAGSYLTQQQSPRPLIELVDAHSHSPRYDGTRQRQPFTDDHVQMPPHISKFPKPPTFDPFTDTVHAAFTAWRQPSSTDVSMPDYASSSSHTRANSSRQITDPMSISGLPGRRDSQVEFLCEAMMPPPPVNTPQNGRLSPSAITPPQKLRGDSPDEVLVDQLENRTTTPSNKQSEKEQSLPPIIQSAAVVSSVKSRKENIQSSPLSIARPASASKEEFSKKVSQTFAAPSNSGNKRQRVVTPTISKTINAEDDSRASPSTRKVSQANSKPEGQVPRRVLSNLTNV